MFADFVEAAEDSKTMQSSCQSDQALGCYLIGQTFHCAGMWRWKALIPSKQNPSPSMARKKKRDDLEPVPIESLAVDPGRQPRVLGWLVLIVGTASTWYWYRPLPPTVAEAVNAAKPNDWSNGSTAPSSIWTDNGLIVPSLTDANAPSTLAPSLADRALPDRAPLDREVPQLVGSAGIALVPMHESKIDIRDVLKTERLPMVPVEPASPEAKNPTSGPSTWVPESMQTPTALLPKTQGAASSWPDVGYVPDSVKQRAALRAATKITTSIPPLLETGMRSIKTLEGKEEQKIEKTGPASQEALQGNADSSSNAPAPARAPAFIRQPKKPGN